MKLLKFFLIIIIAAAFAMTLYNTNSQIVEVSYYFKLNYKVAMATVLLSAFFIGALFGAIVMSFALFRQKMRFSAEHRKLVKIEKEVENLRAMPLKDEV